MLSYATWDKLAQNKKKQNAIGSFLGTYVVVDERAFFSASCQGIH